MEHIGLIVQNASTPTPNSFYETSETRRKVIEAQLKRIALSQGHEQPSPARLSLLVADAMLVWNEIPTRCLSEAVTEGLKSAGSFICSAGTVAKAWKEPKAKPLELGQSKASGLEALEHSREWAARWESMSPEKREEEQLEHKNFFAGLRARLVGGEG